MMKCKVRVSSWNFVALLLFAALVSLSSPVSAGGFPVVELANGSTLPGGGTLNIPMPTGSGGIAAGDLLIVVIASDDNVDSLNCANGGPQTWTFITSASDYVNICARAATGVETVFSLSNPSGLIAGQSYRIVGWTGGALDAGTLEAAAVRTVGGDPNPPSLNPSGWGVEDTLWLAGAAMANNAQGRDFTTPPTGFTLVRYDDGSQQSLMSAYRKEAAASVDPGAFGVSQTPTSWQAWTIAIRPSASVPIVTLAASGIGYDRARLNGRLDILFSSTATLWFEYGDTMALGNTSANVTRTSTGTFQVIISDLAENTTYFFRAHSEEVPSGYANQGAILSFTTAERPEQLVFAINAMWMVVFLFILLGIIFGAWWLKERFG